MKSVTIVWEYNYVPAGAKEQLASVWLFAGDGRNDLERKSAGWFKAVGPVNIDTATEVCDSLKEFFVQGKVEVFEHGIAD